MSKEKHGVKVKLLDTEYTIGCDEGEQESLLSSAHYLNKKLLEQKDTGRVIGNEKIAVLAALNITHEFLKLSEKNKSTNEDFGKGINRINSKITRFLSADAKQFDKKIINSN